MDSAAPLDELAGRLGGVTGLVVAFALVDALLLHLGYTLKETLGDSAVIWPAAGLLLAALWLAPLRLWPLLLVVGLVVEVGMASMWYQPFRVSISILYTLAGIAGTVVGALFLRHMMPEYRLMRTRDTLWLVLGTALGALVAASLGAAITAAISGYITTITYSTNLQTWWGGSWLGYLTVAPAFLCWLSPVRFRYAELELNSRWELVLLGTLTFGFAVHVFSVRDLDHVSLLQLPTSMVAMMLLCAMRLPPRWCATLYALAAVVCAWYISRHRGPFQAEDLLLRVGQGQAFIASLGVISFALSVTIAEKNIAMGLQREAEYRYRSFVELSAEAVWRVELEQPMPVALPYEQQMQWLRQHARVVESSRTYQLIDPEAALGRSLPWRREVGWVAALEDQLPLAATQGYSLTGLSFRINVNGRRHTFVTSFNGVIEDGRLLRIWGVARDITELSELNARLLREQERLKSYARQLVTAEEKARRATAVDLHDGIGQSLAGMAMTLDVARQQVPSEVRGLIEDVRARLREVQDRTRHMISDLSPPGLYELGLEPALQWLTVYMKGKDRLHVEMDTDVIEHHIPLEMRVLVFKLVRELLRNVVKHAGVDLAKLTVSGNAERLRVEVVDRGKGFEWQMDMFGSSVGGFGLWSIADRVHEAGGRFSVDTAPGRGARFEMVFPLGAKATRGAEVFHA